MVNTTATATTAAATAAAAKALQLHSGKVTAGSRAYAKGTQPPAVRDGYFIGGKGFAVDVKRAKGSAAYQLGVITRFFVTMADATAFAASVNDGSNRAGWYATATHAVVVPAYNVPIGKSAVDVLTAAAKPARKPAARKPAATAPTAPAATAASA